jgi:hypothetical protein
MEGIPSFNAAGRIHPFTEALYEYEHRFARINELFFGVGFLLRLELFFSQAPNCQVAFDGKAIF